MPASEKQLYALIRAVRSNFRHLAALGDQLHEDIAVTSSMRAVLEHLVGADAQTVPNIARIKKVSRQHIQQLVDKLYSLHLVEIVPNPAHKRSSLVKVSQQGRTVFEKMREREQRVLAKLCGSMEEDEVRSASRTLMKLQSLVELELNEGEDHDE